MSDEEIPTLSGQDAVDLWLKGRNAWNSWVKENPHADVDFSGVDFGNLRKEYSLHKINFRQFIFPTGSVDFSHAKFGDGKVDFLLTRFGDGNVSFHQATFGEGDVFFFRTTFGKGTVDFTNATFGDGNVSFRSTIFRESGVHFDYAIFGKGTVEFIDAVFGDGGISFRHTTFGEGQVSFHRASFEEGIVDFSKAIFGKSKLTFGLIKSEAILQFKNVSWGELTHLDFQGSTLNGPIYIDPETTEFVPDFRNSIISKKITLHDVRPALKRTKRTSKSFFGSAAKDPDDAARFLRLIELAMDNHDHLSALAYKANFMRAKRWRSIGILPSILDTTVDIVCDYGQSIIRPFVGLLLLLTFLTIFHIGYSDQEKLTYTDKTVASAEYVLASSLPFLSNSRAARIESLSILYGEPTLERKPTPAIVSFLTFFQGIMSIIFFFLIGLGLRNRFKL